MPISLFARDPNNKTISANAVFVFNTGISCLQWECIFAMGTSFANKIPNGKIRHTFMSRLLRTFPPSPLGSLWIMRLHCKFCSLKREGIFSSPCLTASFFCGVTMGVSPNIPFKWIYDLIQHLEIFENFVVNCYKYLFYKDHTNKLEIRPFYRTKWKRKIDAKISFALRA